MRSLFVLLLSFFCCCTLYSQRKHYEIDWVNKKNISAKEGQSFWVPGFSTQHFNYNPETAQITFSAQWKASGNISSSQLTQIRYQPISKQYLAHINTKNLPTSPKFQLKAVSGAQQHYYLLTLNPLINDHGVYKKITAFTIAYTTTYNSVYSTPNNLPQRTNSVLDHGSFFKFSIKKTGVYKLSSDFLESLGMDVSSLDPRTLKIYGQGGKMLPLLNRKTQFYDPPEIAIRVVGGNDGHFDKGDYILFYGIGTQGNWNAESQTNLNLYATQTYYYITAGGTPGKRISNYQSPSGSATTTITTFDDRAFYEIDKYNIGKVGRRWFGDRFDIQNQRTYSFNFPNIVPGSDLTFEVYAASTSEISTNIQANANGQNIGTLTFSGTTGNNAIFATADKLTRTISATSPAISLTLTYHNNGNPAGIAYLDYVNVYAKRKLIAGKKQFSFTNKKAVTQIGIGRYQLSNAQNISEIWNVTNPQHITRIVNTGQQSTLTFKAQLGSAQTYVALSPTDYYQPIRPQNPRVKNSNLKGNTQQADYLIITYPSLLSQAERLARHRKRVDNLSVKVVSVKDIYREFSSGKQDPAAIRNFIRYVYTHTNKPLKYVLLFGDASVDYKDRLSGNNNLVPTFENLSSYSLFASSTATDDFYGMMDASEGTMSSGEKLDLSVGRNPADNVQEAKIAVDKIIAYDSRKSFGDWRNNILLIADDADELGNAGAGLESNLNQIGDSIAKHKPFINVKKIYSDAYEQVNTSGGERYPSVNQDITNNIEVGAVVVNYLGHGGEDGLASEFIVTRKDINSWKNQHKLNTFVTVTCAFTRFDNPLRVSPGELVLANPDGGAVALVSTTREIGVSDGINFNKQLASYLFNYNHTNYSIGEAIMRAKNDIASPAIHVVSFFGDPAMHLAFPKPKIRLTKLNGKPVAQSDTLKALSKIKLSGQVVSAGGNVLTHYNGTLIATVFDKPLQRHTLDNDQIGAVLNFKTLGNVIFRGKASVKNGIFSLNFVVPKDIKMAVGHGRISFYAAQEGKLQDNHGYNNLIQVGGINKNAPTDNKGPEIQLYMNDENFVSGGITDTSPLFIAKLEDENGINTAGGIGHNLIAYIDGKKTEPYILNDYYKAKEDDYTQGSINYKLHALKEGPHTLTFVAWDVYNNSSTAEIQFIVAGNDKLKITHVLNYPNPFHNYTEFWFNHNHPYEPLQVQVQVFTISGKLVWSTRKTITTEGFLSRNITWDGRDEYGKRLGKGVYVYKLTVKSTLTHQKVEKYEKLVIL